MHPHVVICHKFPLYPFIFISFSFLLSVDASQMHRDQVDPSHAKKRKKTLYNSTQTDDGSIRKHRRTLRHSKKNVHLSCQYCVFCPVCKGNKFLCHGFYTNCTIGMFPLPLLPYYHIILTYIHLRYFTWPFVNILHTVCIGNNENELQEDLRNQVLLSQ